MPLTQFLTDAAAAGCPRDQVENFLLADLILQPRQLAASAAARLCDCPGGPTAIGYGGARGGGKSHWLIAQIGADDCQRVPDLKCLLLRKVGKANRESFGDLRRRVLKKLPHHFAASNGLPPEVQQALDRIYGPAAHRSVASPLSPVPPAPGAHETVPSDL